MANYAQLPARRAGRRYRHKMTIRQAIAFIRLHGVILQSAKGLEPSLTARIVGGPVRGSWWSHPRSHEIFAAIQQVNASKAVLVCTLANGKITYIHRRLWPAFVRMAARFPAHALDRVREVHLPSGRHQRQDVDFPAWVPGPVLVSAKRLSVRDAVAQIDVWLQRYGGS